MATLPDLFPWLEGERIHELFSTIVVKRPAADGSGYEVVKAGPIHVGEIAMHRCATENTSVKSPKVRSVIDPPPGYKFGGVAMDFVPGVPLEAVWPNLIDIDKQSLKRQLQEQILYLRSCTLDYIGRVGDERWFPDPYHPSIRTDCGPFANEEEFDSHKVNELAERDPGLSLELAKSLEDLRLSSTSSQFILTHGDLCAHNIIVQNHGKAGSTDWQISGLIDWGMSGFYPPYMEYTMAVNHMGHEYDWRMFLKEVLEEIGLGASVERVRAEAKAVHYLFGQPYYV
ncbi:hypothetical protein LOY97_005175 [Ophidiomyces ophidiicola]|nr:hypothetical protein LOZ49_000189 [Ophidiomyces ophidiicola]KAI2142077.1 hypothetical protein LOZ29_001567 [Ophidiomyces ophidiicola]KAI2144599.1 hypothetical protein LOZ28_001422 [Ophidiomyces ophidiicola]KAI2221095.1 hypothetical protein LOZ15_001955 [Ophidiomyces ophidiicola]KAI2441887.1 hypothetical protein LOZ08_003329 [Ophidiomyces ophidiicola]